MARRRPRPAKSSKLLFKLACSPGRTFSRDQLIEDIWGYDFAGNQRTLDVHINRLRERFPEDRHTFKISTIRGLGYPHGGAAIRRQDEGPPEEHRRRVRHDDLPVQYGRGRLLCDHVHL